MHCQSCGASNAEDRRFCRRCSSALPVRCAFCSFANNPGANFCGSCGIPLPRAPEETKRATLLFADIKGSTELIQGSDPEQIKAILAPVVRIMKAAAERYGGHVDGHPLGDAIMATFGAPQALEDHAVRACLAALSLQDSVRRWNAEQAPINKREFHVRVGLSSGEVVTSFHQNEGSYGEATVLASRMESLAGPDRILMTSSTWLLAKEFVHAMPLGSHAVQGMKEPLEIFQLENAKARTRFNARQNQGLTQFVGRDEEIGVLAKAFGRSAAGDGQVVMVTGGPGIGKSRLIHHFLQLDIARTATVLETTAEPYDRNSVYLPLTNLLRSELSVAPSDPAYEIRAKLEAKLSGREDLLPAALVLLDLPVAREFVAWHDLDPAQKRRRIGEAVRELILKEPRTSTLVLVVEDLQWLDEDTRALVDEFVDEVKNRAILLVLSSRERITPQAPHCQTLDVRSLEPPRASELLMHLVGNGPEAEQIRSFVFRHGGEAPSPLLIEETVSALVERGVLKGEPGLYRLCGDLREFEDAVPHRVEGVLAARIDRLSRDQHAVLGTASVIGMEAPLELLSRVAAVDVERLLRILNELEGADLMYESLTYGQPEFRFKHMLTRDVAAASIPPSRRKDLHERTMLAIESLYQHRRHEWIDRLADHAVRAERHEKACHYCREAGLRAVERWANRQALSFFEKSLAALARMPDDADRKKLEIDVRLLALNALLPLGEQEQVARSLEQAKRLALEVNDPHRLAKVETQLTLSLWESGSHQQALESGDIALRIATERGLNQVIMAARVQIGIVHHALGGFRQSLTEHQAVLDELVAGKLERRRFGWAAYPSIITRAFSADCYLSLGEFDHAVRPLREGSELSEELGHPYSWLMMQAVRGRYYLMHDDPAAALQVLEQAERTCREEEVHTMIPSVVAGLGVACARCGFTDRAIELVQDALDQQIYRKAGNYTRYYLLTAIGEAHLIAGNVDAALARATEAERLARRNAEGAHLAQALHLIGQIHARRDPARAEQAFLEARMRADRHGMTPLAADCWLGLAEIDRLLGRVEAAQRFARAKALFLNLGLTHRAQLASLPS